MPLSFPLFTVAPTWISSRSHLGSGCHSGVISLLSNFLGTLFKHLPHYLPVSGFSKGTDLIESVLLAHACSLACVRASNCGGSLPNQRKAENPTVVPSTRLKPSSCCVQSTFASHRSRFSGRCPVTGQMTLPGKGEDKQAQAKIPSSMSFI